MYLLSSCRRLNGVRSIQTLIKRREKCIFQFSNRMVHIQFIEGKDPDNIIDIDDAPIGKTVLDVALDNNIDIEGACGGINLSAITHSFSAHLSIYRFYFDIRRIGLFHLPCNFFRRCI